MGDTTMLEPTKPGEEGGDAKGKDQTKPTDNAQDKGKGGEDQTKK
jgi:hypothetical protein